jgi:CRISPR-associated protein Cmr2
VQVRVLYGNGNILKSTAKFDVFSQWRLLLNVILDLDSAIFEQAAAIWNQHPAPIEDAIPAWTTAFCDRRVLFSDNETAKNQFQQHLAEFLKALWLATPETDLASEVQNWLKLAAFVLRKRHIEIPNLGV